MLPCGPGKRIEGDFQMTSILSWLAWQAVYAAGFAAVYLIAHAVGRRFLPKIKVRALDGANGRNSGLRVEVDPRAPGLTAVFAHEYAEWEMKYDALRSPREVVRMLREKREFKQDVNLWGKAVEVEVLVALYGRDRAEERRREAIGLATHKGYDYKGWTLERLIEALKDREAAAAKWSNDNSAFLLEWHRKLGLEVKAWAARSTM